MNILVTGGAGFIGSALAERLVRMGHRVVIVDNFDSYYDVSLKRDRIRSLIPAVPVYFLDITNKPALRALFAVEQFDLVCHLAAQAGVRYSIENPSAYVNTNILGTQNIYDLAKEFSVMRVVLASSSSVYGVDTPSPFSEVAHADRPASLYAASKRAGELIAHTYYEQFGIKSTVLRFFTVYGPWGRPDMALYKFAELIQSGKPIELYNNGNHARDFTYIDDIVEGVCAAVTQPLDFEIINLGRGQQVELLQYVQALEQALGVTAEKKLLPMQVGDIHSTSADISKAQRLLQYQPKVSVEEGVRNFAEWFLAYKAGKV